MVVAAKRLRPLVLLVQIAEERRRLVAAVAPLVTSAAALAPIARALPRIAPHHPHEA